MSDDRPYEFADTEELVRELARRHVASVFLFARVVRDQDKLEYHIEGCGGSILQRGMAANFLAGMDRHETMRMFEAMVIDKGELENGDSDDPA